MAYYLDSTRVIITDKSVDNKQIIARLQPLASGTVHHIFGYEDKIVKITAKVVGDTDKEAIEAMTRDANTHTLWDDAYNAGSFLVSSATFNQDPTKWQSLRQDLPCDDPVYTTEIVLYKEV